MKVLVFEPISSGHRFAYLKLLLPSMCEFGVEPILVTTQQARQSSSFDIQLQEVVKDYEIIVEDAYQLPTTSLNRELAKQFDRALSQFRPDHAFLPVGDGIAQYLAVGSWIGSATMARQVDTEALHFKGQSSTSSKLKRAANRYLLARAPWSTFFHLDANQLGRICKGNDRLRSRAVVMPDPIAPFPNHSKVEAREGLCLPTDGRIIGTAGMIQMRKGIDHLLRAFVSIKKKLASNDRVLLAGPQDSQTRKLIDGEFRSLLGDQLLCIDRFLSAGEIADSLISMDVVATPYPRHIGSSSIVIQAAAIGRPIVASEFDWIGMTTRSFGLGSVCDVRNTTEFAKKLLEAIDEHTKFETTARAKRFIKFHSAENFSATWLSRLSKKINKPLKNKPIPWEWVTGQEA